MAFGIITEALARIEHKLDLILKIVGLQTANKTPMKFTGHLCPVCDQLIDYIIDLNHNVVVRKCSCSTGKLPPTISLLPATSPIGGNNGYTPADPAEDEGPGQGPQRRRR
jgi:hypothetical protein